MGCVFHYRNDDKTLLKKIFGDDSAEETPVPISNTEVKLCCADGTARETGWESRSSPNFIYPVSDGVFFCTSLLFFRYRGLLVER